MLRVPIFALAVKGSAALDGLEFRHSRRREERRVESVIRTERDASLPYPGPLSRRVHMAILDIVAERGLPFSNPVEWTWRDLCRRMGLPNSGRRVGELKGALRATWGLKIFGLTTTTEGRSQETWRRLYADCEFLKETRADGTVADANRLWLAPWYLDSLNALHSAPIDYDLWKRLEKVGPIASRLYEYLVPAFYKNEALELAYDRLAAAMPVVVESRRSHALRQFGPALDALRAEGVIADLRWDAMKGTGRPKLILTRGPILTPTVRETGAAASRAVVVGADDPEAPARLAGEFYRLLGKETKPFRSDLAVARDLIGRFGPERSAALLPDAVRRLKARFRNAETMGPLGRYFDEVAAEADRREQQERAQKQDAAKKAEAIAQDADDDRRRQAIWDALPGPWRDTIRAAVLAEKPMYRKFPALLEAACLEHLAPDEPGKTPGGPSR